MTIYWHGAGLKITYGKDQMLVIEDLNPEARIAWHMTRWEMARLASKALFAAMKGR